MQFRNPNDLLVYLVELSDSDRVSMLLTGQSLLDAARQDGKIEWNQGEFAQLAQHLWALKRDGSVTFEDYAWSAMRRPGDPDERPLFRPVDYGDLDKAARIVVTSTGRLAAQASRPTLAINVGSIDMTVLLSAVEDEIAAIDAPEDVKDEARSRLHAASAALGNVATTAAGEVLGVALRRTLGWP